MKIKKRILACFLTILMVFQVAWSSDFTIQKTIAATDGMTQSQVDTLIKNCLQIVLDRPTYSTENRNSANSYDCSSFAARVIRDTFCGGSCANSVCQIIRNGTVIYSSSIFNGTWPWVTDEWLYAFDSAKVGDIVKIGTAVYKVKMVNITYDGSGKLAAKTASTAADYEAAWATPGSIVVQHKGNTYGHASIALGTINWTAASAYPDSTYGTVTSVVDFIKTKYGYDLSGITNSTEKCPMVYTETTTQYGTTVKDSGNLTGEHNVWKFNARSVKTGVGVDNAWGGKGNEIGLCLEPVVTSITCSFNKTSNYSNGTTAATNISGATYAVYTSSGTAEKIAASGSLDTNTAHGYVTSFTTVNGNVSVTLPSEGTYYLAEITAPSGTIRSTSVITINASNNGTYTLTNTSSMACVSLNTYLRDKNYPSIAISGTFRLYEWSQSANRYYDTGYNLTQTSTGNFVKSFNYTSHDGTATMTGGYLCETNDNKGYFKLEQTSFASNYTASTTTTEFNIKNTSSVTVYNIALVSLTIYKKDDIGNAVSNVQFNFYYGGANHYATTNSSGIAYINSVPEGTYGVLYETSTPSQYLPDSNYKSGVGFTVSRYNASTFAMYKNVVNERLGRLSISKVDYYTGSGIADTYFTLYKDSGCSQIAADINGNAQSWIRTNSSGAVTTGQLLHGTYYLKEVQAANGYILDSSVKTIVINGGATQEYSYSTVKNNRQTVQINFKKNSATPTGSLSLGGAKYELYANSTMKLVENNSYIYDGNYLGTYTTDANGYITITRTASGNLLPNGYYYLKEVAAADGYFINTSLVYIDAHYTSQTTSVLQVSASQTETRQNVSMTVYKLDADFGSFNKDGDTSLIGVKFKLINKTNIIDVNTGSTIPAGTVLGYYEIDNYGQFTASTFNTGAYSGHLIPNGTYAFIEYQTNKNFSLLTEEQVFDMSFTQTTSTLSKSKNVINNRQYISLQLIKKDAETSDGKPMDCTYATLQGAKYALYTTSDIIDVVSLDVIPAGTYLGTYTTDSNGIIVATTILEGTYATHKLPNGNYRFIEVEAPEGYILDDTPIDYTATWNSSNTNSVLTVSNDVLESVIKQSITINKHSDDVGYGEKVLSGIGFTVYSVKDVLEKNGISYSDLPFDTESVMQNGYFGLDSDKVSSLISGVSPVTFTNGEMNYGNKSGVSELFTDTNGDLTFYNLAYGEYIIFESTPNAYFNRAYALYVAVPYENGTHLMDENPSSIIQEDVVNTSDLAYLKIITVDSETGDIITFESTLRIHSNTYDYGKTFDDIKTKEGIAILDTEIASGQYEIEVVSKPDGYKTPSENAILEFGANSISATYYGEEINTYFESEDSILYLVVELPSDPIHNNFFKYEILTDESKVGRKDAVLGLYKTKLVDGKYVIDGDAYWTWTSDEMPKHLLGLNAGTYIWREIDAPKKYEIANDIVVVITEDGENYFEMEDVRMPFNPTYNVSIKRVQTPKKKGDEGYGFYTDTEISYKVIISNTGNCQLTMDVDFSFVTGIEYFDKVRIYLVQGETVNSQDDEKNSLNITLEPGDEMTVYYVAHIKDGTAELLASSKDDTVSGYQCSSIVSNVSAFWKLDYGYDTAAEVMEGWMNSPGHRANILRDNFTSISIAVDINPENELLYWVQVFGDK